MSQLLSLHRTSDEMLELYRLIGELDGELTPEIEEKLDALAWNRKVKAESIIRVVRERLRVAEAQKAEADELAAMARSNRAQAESLKAYLLREMRQLGEEKIHGETFTIVRQKAGGVPRIECDEIPDDCKRVVPARVEFDRKKAYEKIRDQIPSEPGEYTIEGMRVTVGERLVTK